MFTEFSFEINQTLNDNSNNSDNKNNAFHTPSILL